MIERKKLELALNTPTQLKLIYDSPIIGESQYGKYYLYAVLNGDGTTEYSYFADKETHDQLCKLKKGDEFEITKVAVQRGKKLVTTIAVNVLDRTAPIQSNSPSSENTPSTPNNYLSAMRQSFKDALQINDEFAGVNLNQIAVTLFIQRTKHFNSALT